MQMNIGRVHFRLTNLWQMYVVSKLKKLKHRKAQGDMRDFTRIWNSDSLFFPEENILGKTTSIFGLISLSVSQNMENKEKFSLKLK